MKISVLIAAYRAAATIERTIASVQAQTHRDWELIVVEDGSHDGTEEIVRRISTQEDRLVRYENFGINRGVSSARNRLLALATGDAVAFIDADDLWSDVHLEKGIQRLAAGADLVATGVRVFDLASGTTLSTSWPPRTLESDPVKTLFQQSVIVTSSSVFLSRRVLERVGAFDPGFRVGEDRDYWLRAALSGARFEVEPSPTCHYAKYGASTMSKTQLVTEQVVRFYEKYLGLTAVPKALRHFKLAEALANQGRLTRATDPRASIRHLSRALRLTPINATVAAQLLLSIFRSRLIFRIP